MRSSLSLPLGGFWAHVSEEVDTKLKAQQQAKNPFRLTPHEWKNGKIPWLLAVLAALMAFSELSGFPL